MKRDASGQGEPLLAAAKRMLASSVWGLKGSEAGRHLEETERLSAQTRSTFWKKPEAYVERETSDAIFPTQGMKWPSENGGDDDERRVDSVAEYGICMQTIPYRVRISVKRLRVILDTGH